ncbi:ABC transporter substrate-binding protein [Actinophytocola sp.]|uniref:ABC transporter substrate-binding protein n=1 Tax=Actinophytocola sp. TaxID=1872138 RepID=UPI003D6C2D87
MNNRHRLVRLALAPVLVLAAACGGNDSDGAGGGEPVITLGGIFPLTGGIASLGQSMANGTNIAIKEINDAGGIEIDGRRHRLAMDTCDDEGTAEAAIACARRLAADGPPAIITLGTYAALPMLGFNERDGYVLLAASSVPELTERGNKLVMRIVHKTSDSVPNLAASTAKHYEEGSAEVTNAVALRVNTDLGAEWVEAFRNGWQKAGKVADKVIDYDQNATDFSPQVGAALNSDPDVIAFSAGCKPTAIFINQAIQQGYDGKFVFGSPCADLPTLTPLLDDIEVLEDAVLEVTPWTLGGPEVERVRDAIQREYGGEPEWVAGLGYDGLRVLARAIELAASSSDPQQIHDRLPDALTELRSELLMGAQQMDPETGDTTFKTSAAAYQQGELVEIDAG